MAKKSAETVSDKPTKTERLTYGRMFAASVLATLVAWIASAGVSFLVIMVTFSSSSDTDISDVLGDLAVGILVATILGFIAWVIVATVSGRVFVRMLTNVAVKLWQTAVAFIPVVVVFTVISTAFNSIDSDAAAAASLLITLVAAPAVSALILFKLAESERA